MDVILLNRIGAFIITIYTQSKGNSLDVVSVCMYLRWSIALYQPACGSSTGDREMVQFLYQSYGLVLLL